MSFLLSEFAILEFVREGGLVRGTGVGGFTGFIVVRLRLQNGLVGIIGVIRVVVGFGWSCLVGMSLLTKSFPMVSVDRMCEVLHC